MTRNESEDAVSVGHGHSGCHADVAGCGVADYQIPSIRVSISRGVGLTRSREIEPTGYSFNLIRDTKKGTLLKGPLFCAYFILTPS